MDRVTLEKFARKAVKISSNNKMIKTEAKREKDGFVKQPILDLWSIFRYNQSAVDTFLSSSDAILEINTEELTSPSERDELNNLVEIKNKLKDTLDNVESIINTDIAHNGAVIDITDFLDIVGRLEITELNKLGKIALCESWVDIEHQPDIFMAPSKPKELIDLEDEAKRIISSLGGHTLSKNDESRISEILSKSLEPIRKKSNTDELDKYREFEDKLQSMTDEFNSANIEYQLKVENYNRKVKDAVRKIHSGITNIIKELNTAIDRETSLVGEIKSRFSILITNAKTINDKSIDLYRRTSVFSFYLGAYYFCGFIGKNEVKAPLIMFPVTVDISAASITISHVETRDIIINNILMLLLQNSYGKADALNFNPIDLDNETIQSRIESIIKLFGLDCSIPTELEQLPCKNQVSNSIEIKYACGYTTYEVMSSIYRDIKELAKHGDEESSIDRLFSLKYDDCNTDNNTYRISQLDTSQMSAVRMVDNCSGTVIFGPPGTGKSEVITNIIVDQVRKGKKCLVVSQKSTALDVVYNRLKAANRLALYMPDSSVRSGGSKSIGSGPDIINSISIRLNRNEFGEFNTSKIETLDSMINSKLNSLESIHKLLTTPVQECSKCLSEMYADAIPYDLLDKILVAIRSKYDWMLKLSLPQLSNMYSSISDNQIWLSFVSVQKLGDSPNTYHNMSKNDLIYVERKLTEIKRAYMELSVIEETEAKYPYTILRDIYESIECIKESLYDLGVQSNAVYDADNSKIAISSDLRDNLQKIRLELSSYKTMLRAKELKRSAESEIDYYLKLKNELSNCESILMCESFAGGYDTSDISDKAIISNLTVSNLLNAVNTLYKVLREAGEKYGIEVRCSDDLRKSKDLLLFNEYESTINQLRDVLGLYSKYDYKESSCSDTVYKLIFKDPWGYTPVKLGFFQMMLGREKAENVIRAANLDYTIKTAMKKKEMYCSDIDKCIEYLADLELEYRKYFDSLAIDLDIHYDESSGLLENMIRAIAYTIAAYNNLESTINTKIEDVYKHIIEYDKQLEEIKKLAQECIDKSWEVSALNEIENIVKNLMDKEAKGVKVKSLIKDGLDFISQFGLSTDVEYELSRLIEYKSNSAAISLIGSLSDQEYGLLSLIHECNCKFDDVLRALITYRLNDLEDLGMDDVSTKNIKKIINDINSYEIFRGKYILETLESAPSDMKLYSAMSAGIGKKSKHPTLRSFVNEYQDLLLDNFPIWIMTPESVSDVLPLRKNMFDLVIFDEASQLYLWAALPSVYRAAKIAVAGDDKQLKPENLFSTKLDDEESENIEDVNLYSGDKSLLDQAKETFNSIQLKFHYRARFSELIQFSNYAFYNNTLNVAPNLYRDCEPIIYRYMPNGTLDRHVNWDEAREVASIILNEIKNNYDEVKTFGVITMNVYQRNGVKQAFDEMCTKLSRRDAKSEDKRAFEIINKLNSSHDTEIFIKSIADVQGDERDIIIFSLGYGYDSSGKLKCNLGQLNVLGGENRLNVAISRAKEKEYIVTSILPSDIGDTDRFTNDGGKLFKQFLQYAKAVSDGNIRTANSIVQAKEAVDADNIHSESTLQDSIKTELECRGFEIHTNVGTGDFRVNLAVFNRQLGRYIGCIEYDGEAYRKSNDAYARDIMHERFLISRGWRVVRVTSRDWWNGLEQEADRIQRELSEAEKYAEYNLDMYANELSLDDIDELLSNIRGGCKVDTNTSDVMVTTYNKFSKQSTSRQNSNVKDVSVQPPEFYTIEKYKYIADRISAELGTITCIYTGDKGSLVGIEDAALNKLDINSIIIGNTYQIKSRNYGDLIIASIIFKVALRELVGFENDPLFDEASYLSSFRTQILRDVSQDIRGKVAILNSSYCISKSVNYDDAMKKCKIILGKHSGGFRVSSLDIDTDIFPGII